MTIATLEMPTRAAEVDASDFAVLLAPRPDSFAVSFNLSDGKPYGSGYASYDADKNEVTISVVGGKKSDTRTAKPNEKGVVVFRDLLSAHGNSGFTITVDTKKAKISGAGVHMAAGSSKC